MSETLKAPFPWFGGKSRAAHLVWSAFGDVANYVEPFAGSLAVLLARPTPQQTETVNDLDCFVANFWRAVAHAPDDVARWADWPVNEADLEARHLWLVNREEFRAAMKADPDHYDAKIAGWWVWGLCSWIGSGWCSGKSSAQLPHLSGGKGINRKLPHLGDRGRGINETMHQLASRLRDVRVACGDWARVVTPAVTTRHGITGVLLDPPYPSANRCEVYTHDQRDVAYAVADWARENGDNPLMRIALCGYEGEHDMPDSWECVAWKAAGGYASQKKSGTNDNAKRERIWFSPHCLHAVSQGTLL